MNDELVAFDKAQTVSLLILNSLSEVLFLSEVGNETAAIVFKLMTKNPIYKDSIKQDDEVLDLSSMSIFTISPEVLQGLLGSFTLLVPYEHKIIATLLARNDIGIKTIKLIIKQ